MTGIQFDDADDPLDIRYDNIFKAVFTKPSPQSQGALSRFVSALIGQKVSVVTVAANEPPIDNTRDRQIRFDIGCRTEKDEPVDVEMSLNPTPVEPVRLEFLIGKLFSGQDIKGEEDYGILKPAYQITVLAKGRFFEDDEFLHTFEYYDPEHDVSLGGRGRIITLELSNLGRVAEKSVGEMTAPEHWALFFQYLTDKSKRRMINEIVKIEEGIAMAGEVLMTISRDEAERIRLMSEFKYRVDTQSHINGAKREIARNFKAMGLSTEQIVRGTGLSEEQIRDL